MAYKEKEQWAEKEITGEALPVPDPKKPKDFKVPEENSYQTIDVYTGNGASGDETGGGEETGYQEIELVQGGSVGPFDGSALYQMYQNRYMREADFAQRGVAANAALMTGGYGNSYGAVAGAQAYNEVMDDFHDVIPGLMEAAYSDWEEEKAAADAVTAENRSLVKASLAQALVDGTLTEEQITEKLDQYGIFEKDADGTYGTVMAEIKEQMSQLQWGEKEQTRNQNDTIDVLAMAINSGDYTDEDLEMLIHESGLFDLVDGGYADVVEAIKVRASELRVVDSLAQALINGTLGEGDVRSYIENEYGGVFGVGTEDYDFDAVWDMIDERKGEIEEETAANKAAAEQAYTTFDQELRGELIKDPSLANTNYVTLAFEKAGYDVSDPEVKAVIDQMVESYREEPFFRYEYARRDGTGVVGEDGKKDGTGNYIFYRNGKEYEYAPGINPYTNTTNPDIKYGTCKNGYQPNNVASYYKEDKNPAEAGKLTKSGKTDVVNGVTQNVWMTPDGKLWIWDGTQNQYLEYLEDEE